MKMKDDNGFTLLEVMLAVVILSFGLLSMYSLQLLIIRGNSSANRIGTSIFDATSALDIVMTKDYKDSELDAAIAQDADDLYNTSGHFSNTVTYTVATNNNVNTLFSLQNDTFTGVTVKQITMNVTAVSAGGSGSLNYQFIKFDM